MALNIYLFDADPVLAAQTLDDRRLLAAYGAAESVLATACALRRWTTWREMHAGDGRGGPTLTGYAHPRHPITRHAARSPAYARWVTAYGGAAAQEVAWRGLRPGMTRGLDDHEARPAWLTESFTGLRDALADVERESPACPAAGFRIEWLPGGDVFCGFPQRLDGGQDLAEPGNPVVGYRRWFATTRVPGAPGAWEGTEAAWTRRIPPAWLVDVERGRCELDEVPWCGLGSQPSHPTWTVRFAGRTVVQRDKPLDATS